MYKRASRNMQHAHRVDQIDPSGGYIAGSSDDDLLVNAENLGEQECKSELDQLQNELVRAQQALTVAKLHRDKEQIKSLGMRILTLSTRRIPIRARLKRLQHERNQYEENQCLGEAVRNVLEGTPYLEKIWAEKDRILALRYPK